MDPGGGEAYRQEIEDWHARRLARLRAPGGWLSLVDRLLLEPGDNELPIGTATVEGDAVRLRVAPGLEVTGAAGPVTEIVLRAEDGGASERLVSGGRTYELIRRGESLAIRVKDPESPLLREFSRVGVIDRYPVNPSFRVVARFERHQPPRTTRLSFDLGEGPPRTVPGVARFELAGRALSLEPIIEEDSQRLFFVFGDETNRQDTYPGGRFLYAALPSPGDGGSEAVVLDFNLAFNPPCAFTPFATCPAIPTGNRLAVAVTAGERRYPPTAG